MLAGNVVALLAPVVIIPIFTVIFGVVSDSQSKCQSYNVQVLIRFIGQVRLEVDDGYPQGR